VAYCALRTTIRDPAHAFSKIGPKYGDDGIDAIEPASMLKVGKDLGLSVKIEQRSTSDFVTFCGRYYINPRTSQHSIFNVRKALMSLPVAYGTNAIERKRHLKAKIIGYLAMDPETPVMSQYAKALFEILGLGDEKIVADYGRDLNAQYKASLGPWPRDNSDAILEQEKLLISKIVGFNIVDYDRIMDILLSCKHPGDLAKLRDYIPQGPVERPSRVVVVPENGRRRTVPLKEE
jgi:hypothetical protein